MSRWQGPLSALAALIGFLGSLGIAYLWAVRLNWQWDASPDARFTLSAYTRQVLARLREPLRVVGFVPSSVASGREVQELLEQLARESARLRVEVFDINRNPERARRYGVNTNLAVVVEGAHRKRIVTHPTELAISTAIVAVHRRQVPTVYWQCSDEDRRSYDRARHALSDEGFDVRPLDLTSPVPADGEVLVACATETPSPALTRNLETYLARGGRALLLVEPDACDSLPALCSWLSGAWGLGVSGEALVDPASRLAAGDPYTFAIRGLAADHPVTAVLNRPPLVSGVTAVRWLGQAGEERTGWVLLSTAPSARISAKKTSPSGGPAHASSPASLPIAVAVVGPARTSGEARMVVVGDADFAADGFLEFLGNRDLLLNALNWLVDEVDLLGMRTAARAEGIQQFFLSAADARELLWWTCVVPAACFFLAALLVWQRRRWHN